MGFYVEVPEAPQRDLRFVSTFSEGNIKWGTLSAVCRQVSKGVWEGSRPTRDFCVTVVDQLRAAAASGRAPKYLASAVVVEFRTPNRKIVYPIVQEKEKSAENLGEVPKVAQDSAGVWRVVPTEGFTQGPRGWIFKDGFRDKSGEPRIISVAHATKRGVIELMFDSMFPIYADYVSRLPLAAATDIPQPPAPVVERTYSKAELAAVPAFPREEYDKLPAKIAQERYLLDPLFKAGVDRMWEHEERVREAFARKEQNDAHKRAADDLRRKNEAIANAW